MARRNRLLLLCALALCAIGLICGGYWFGMGSMVYSSNCEVRHIAKACEELKRLQDSGGALMVGGWGAVVAFVFVFFKVK